METIARHYELLANNIMDLVCELDLDGCLLYASPSHQRVLGWAPEEMLGRPFSTWMHPDELEGFHQRLAQVIERGEHQREMRLRDAQGQYHWFECFCRVQHDESGQPCSVAVACHGIDARKRAEAEQVRHTLLLEAAQEAAGVGYFVMDIRNRRWEGSPLLDRIFGIGPDYPHTMDGWTQLLHPDERQRMHAHFEHVVRERRPFSNAYRIVRANDGATRWVEAFADFECDAEGNPLRMIGTTCDITERKQAENERSRLFDLTLDMVCIAGADGRFRQVNPAWTRALGWSEAELCSRPWIEFVHPDDREATRATAGELFCGRPVVGFENRYRCKDGSYRWIYWDAISQDDDQLIYAVCRDVTESRRARQALEDSEERFRQAFEHAGIGIALKALDGRWLRVNHAMCSIVGYTEEELQQRTADQPISHPDDIGRTTACEADLLAGRQTAYELEKRYLHKNGSVVWVRINSALVRNGQGQPLYFVQQVQDITVAREAQRALYDQEMRYQVMADHAPFILSAIDRNGNYVLWNRFAEHLLGYSAAEALTELKPEDLVIDLALLDEISALMDEGDKLERDVQLRHKDGHLVDVHVVLVPYRNRRGQVQNLYGFAIDLTERRKVEEQQSLLHTTIEQCSESIFITRTDGTIDYVNPAFCRTTGYSTDEVIGATPRILRSGLHEHSFYQSLWETLLRGDVWRGCVVNRRKNGELCEEYTTITPVRDGSGQIIRFVAVKLDLSREEQLRQQLRQAERLALVGRTITSAAHQLKNILTLIHGSSQQIAREIERMKQPAIAEIWPIHQRSIDKIDRLARMMLNYARLDQLNLELTDIGVLLDELCAQQAAARPLPTIEIGCNVAADLPQVWCDPLHMGDALLNLINNGVEAVGNQGVGQVQVRARRDETGEGVAIEIEDDGPGIPPDKLHRVCEPFYTTKSNGTGLGLPMAHKIIEEHGGALSIESIPGHTVFKVHLPLRKSAATE